MIIVGRAQAESVIRSRLDHARGPHAFCFCFLSHEHKNVDCANACLINANAWDTKIEMDTNA